MLDKTIRLGIHMCVTLLCLGNENGHVNISGYTTLCFKVLRLLSCCHFIRHRWFRARVGKFLKINMFVRRSLNVSTLFRSIAVFYRWLEKSSFQQGNCLQNMPHRFTDTIDGGSSLCTRFGRWSTYVHLQRDLLNSHGKQNRRLVCFL